MRDLGFWRRLTRHLGVVQVATRDGRSRIPRDRHVADAYWTASVGPSGAKGLCSIVFYPSAMRAELRRERAHFATGATGPPVGARRLWTSVLAHELAHCLPGQPGELVATSWERRTLRALGEN